MVSILYKALQETAMKRYDVCLFILLSFLFVLSLPADALNVHSPTFRFGRNREMVRMAGIQGLEEDSTLKRVYEIINYDKIETISRKIRSPIFKSFIHGDDADMM